MKSSRRTSKSRAPSRRRTQTERRATSTAKLIDATIESILEVGYSRTTVREICKRAKLSDGALFRLFPTLLDLILAAVSEVGQRQIAQFETRFTEASNGAAPLITALSVLREMCRSKNNVVFYEMIIAARTDPALRRKLTPEMEAYKASIRAAADRLPGIEAIPAHLRDAIIFGFAYIFDGETLTSQIHPQAEANEQRLQLLQAFLRSLAEPRRARLRR
jgi:AcrR family transcriptional regulator